MIKISIKIKFLAISWLLNIGLHISDFISVGPGHAIDCNEDLSIVCIKDKPKVCSWDDLLARFDKITKVLVMSLEVLCLGLLDGCLKDDVFVLIH